jgi:hypothetical protein
MRTPRQISTFEQNVISSCQHLLTRLRSVTGIENSANDIDAGSFPNVPLQTNSAPSQALQQLAMNSPEAAIAENAHDISSLRMLAEMGYDRIGVRQVSRLLS